MKFTDLELKPAVLDALEAIGYQEMTPIQEKAIPHILQGSDVMGLAETGSGKTGACGVPLVHLVDPKLKAVQVLILVPTRELALQYVQEVDDIAGNTGVVPFAIYGGFDMGIQKAKLSHGVHILVATPGRLIDFIWNTRLDLTQVRTAVLDEADEMLKMGFIEDVDFIMSCMIHEHQNLLFSATMPREIERLTKAYLKDPVKVELNRDQKAPQSLQHCFQYIGNKRLDVLIEYLKDESVEQAIVFSNSRDKGQTLYQALRKRLDSLEFIHGGLDQERRTSIFRRFKSKQIKIMVATDVAGRGLDFSHVSHVINYDFPLGLESYTHRTGRTGRMGRTGTALTFVGDRDFRNLKRLLAKNRIEPIWRGDAPDLDKVPSGSGGGRGRPSGGGGGGKGRSRSRRPRSGSGRGKPAAKAPSA